MPKVINFRANSVVYFYGDTLSDKIYVLQKGQVSLNYTDIESGKDIHEPIQVGEFFGVKSALGKYPREENCVVLMDAQVLAFTVPEFEVYAQAQTRIIMKMLRVFSNQLRRVHKQVDTLLRKSVDQSPELGLLKTGRYYLKARLYNHAKYIFSRYLTYFPTGKYANEASHNLETAEDFATKYGDGNGPVPNISGTEKNFKSQQATGNSVGQAPISYASSNSNTSSDGLSGLPKKYYDALSLLSSERYKEALSSFKLIVESKEDSEFVPKALFDMGRCLFMLKQYELTIKHFTQLIQSYPKHPDLLEALYYLGQSYEKNESIDRAMGFYKKIISMETDEDSATRIRAVRALKKIEESING